MRIPRKIVIPALTVLIGASLAGSISSTIAWYQYATKAQVAYTGTTSHCSKLLRISADGGSHWSNDIASSAFPDVTFAPITTGAQLKNAALPENFYVQPNLRQGAYENWQISSTDNYSQFEILVKVNDVNTASPQLVNEVFLTDVTIQDASTNGSLDLSKAIRVHVATTYGDNHKYFLFAKNVTSTDVGGFLDLNNDGEYDTVGYDWDQTKVLYGGGTVDTSTNPETVTPEVQTSYLMNDSNIIAEEDQYGQISGGTSIGTTSSTVGEYLRVTVTIWLEGWAMLQHGIADNIRPTNTQVWDSAKYTSKSFNVGLTFGVKLHSDAE